jgi:DNA-binding transcriptional regulator YdaS (Cro superfamily)
MLLKEYLERTTKDNETIYERQDRFARNVGVTGSCVRKWVYKQRRMSDAMKLKVVRATKGLVTIEEIVRDTLAA